MAVKNTTMTVTVLAACMGLLLHVVDGTLSVGFYDKTCPSMEKVVRETVSNASRLDPKVPARILRMHFHDCFVRGCDGSVLLDSKGNNTAEKDAPPNVSLRAFYVIDDAKAKLETVCPRTVSCADILAVAARDVVTLTGGPSWGVMKGRRDGVVSRANETRALPAPTFNVTQLISAFAQRGLSTADMVALSGGHTIGFSHCSSFASRLRNFSTAAEVDPTMHFQLAVSLRSTCPASNANSSAGAFLDSTANTFDNTYFRNVRNGKGIFHSDQALWNEDPRTRALVAAFAKDQGKFFKAFASSMAKMGNVGVLTGSQGEVRLKCRTINAH